MTLNRPFERLSLLHQFLGVTTLILVVGMAIIGTWIGSQIETISIHRAISMAAIYVESILAAQRDDWSVNTLDADTHAALDRLFLAGRLSSMIVRIKFWHPDGTIFYSNDHSQIGERVKIDADLAAAFRGEVRGEAIKLEGAEHAHERALAPRMLEVFVPMRAADGQNVVAVAEFYYSNADIDRDIRHAQARSWFVVLIATTVMWLLVQGMVWRANSTIVQQQDDLRTQLAKQEAMLAENLRMQDRLRDAGERTTALNEGFVQRTAASLHDGPAQDLALALLRFENIAEPCPGCARVDETRRRDIDTVRSSLVSSLEDTRAIASDLRIPAAIATMTMAGTVERAIREYERKYDQQVAIEVRGQEASERASMAAKITAYRLVQETLANGWWHARGCPQKLVLRFEPDRFHIEVSDEGPGFDADQPADSGRLGLALVSERVQVLGGTFDIQAAAGKGTCIKAVLPLSAEDPAIA